MFQDIPYKYFDPSKGSEKTYKMANIGGHQMQHLLASIGLFQGVKPKSEECKKLGDIVKNFAKGNLDLTQSSLSNLIQQQDLKVEVLVKDELRNSDPLIPENKELYIALEKMLLDAMIEQHFCMINSRGVFAEHSLMKTALAALENTDGKSMVVGQKR